MNYADILKECLQNPFSIDNYRKFVVNFLNGTQLREISGLRSAEIFAEYSFYVEGFALIANYVDPKGKRVGIFAVKLKNGRDIEKARNKQRNFIARLIADNNLDAALAAFYLNEETKWRLSFVRLDYEFVKGKIKQSLTPAKRYSYLVGKDEPCHTAQESLLPVFESEDFRPTIDSIEQAFSVEKVTKQFFEKYKEKYLQLTEYLENTPCFVEEAQIRGFTTEQFAKKLMGQIVFMYFLQKKGWLGVKAIKQTITTNEYKKLFWHNAKTREFAPRLYTQTDENTYKLNQSALADLSDEDEMYIAMEIKGEPWGTGPRTFMRDLFNFAMRKKANFFDDYLEPLFYEGMNRQRDADNYYPRLHCRIPFLNGGLFEELGHYDWRNNAFHIPNEMFSNAHLKSDPREADGILDIFDRYNFTMNEDEPLEKEVAVDPEMLGKIFENLLDVKDRKSKGAFYTPREIVHYMCQESLINYLVNTVGTPYEDTKDFVLYGDIMKDEDCSREGTYGVLSEMLMPDCIYQNLQAIDNALADVRVADPAVGSGAFPMGMLSEIVKLREIITEYMARDLCQRPEYRGLKNQSALKIAIRKLHNEQRNAYKLKKEAMRNSIYAVDIEPSAVDIAKLRLWLTLVVEQEIDPKDPENDSPLTLPNLDCNVMCGNSLIDEFEGIDLSFDSILFGNNGQGTLWSGDIDVDLENLFAAQKEYFYADNHDKKKKYADLIEEIKARLLDHAFTSADAEKRARFEKASAEASTPFFLWKLNFAKVFKEKGGFDIVIGNPPYIRERGNQHIFDSVNKAKLGKLYHQGKMDYWYYFLHLAIDISNINGSIGYITPRYWINSAGATKLIFRIKKELTFVAFVDIGNIKTFENVEGYHMIAIYDKAKKTDALLYKRLNSLSGLLAVQSCKDAEIKILSNNKIVSDKGQIILGDYSYESEMTVGEVYTVAQGVVEASDRVSKNAYARTPREGFFVGQGVFVLTESEIEQIGLSDYERQALKKYLDCKDVSRWAIDFDGKYLIYSDKAMSEKIANDAQLVKIKQHLDHMSAYITSSNAPYGLHRPRKIEEFQRKKIIGPSMFKINQYALDNEGYFVGMSFNVINQLYEEYSLEYLIAILNSKFALNWFYQNGKHRGAGVDIGVDKLREFPLPLMEKHYSTELEALVKKIIDNKGCDCEIEKLEDRIDEIVYILYGLTAEEIALVENTVK